MKFRKEQKSHNKKFSNIFKITDLVDLRLIGNKTYIYINNKRFRLCVRLLLNIPVNRIHETNQINSIDEVAEVFSYTLLNNVIIEGETRRSLFQNHTITPEEEFRGHCSNIEAFFETGLNTDILPTNIAFPLLKKLVELGYTPAIRVFKEELVKRFNEGTVDSRTFLINQKYLKYLNKEEKQIVFFNLICDISVRNVWKSSLCNEFSKKIKTTEDMLTRHHVHYDEKDNDRIKKNEKIIKKWIRDFYWSTLKVKREMTEEEEIAISLKDKYIIKAIERLSEHFTGNILATPSEWLREWFIEKFPVKSFIEIINILDDQHQLTKVLIPSGWLRKWFMKKGSLEKHEEEEDYSRIFQYLPKSDKILIPMYQILKDYCEGKIDKNVCVEKIKSIESEDRKEDLSDPYTRRNSLHQEIAFLEASKIAQNILSLPEDILLQKRQRFAEIISRREKELQGTDYGIELPPKEELTHLFNLIEEGIATIESLMKEQYSDELTIPINNILEIFNHELFITSRIDGSPIFKPEVIDIFMSMGIFTIAIGNTIKFIKLRYD